MGVVVVLGALAGCAKAGSSRKQKAADEQRDRELAEEIERTITPYRHAIEAFLTATASGDFGAAYGMLAPAYTNMVTQEAFVQRHQGQQEFPKTRSNVKILRTSAQAGTTHARCVLGELGFAEIDLFDRRLRCALHLDQR